MVLQEFINSFSSALIQTSFPAFGIAFLAGIVASAVCPCTLPVGLGMAGMAGASESQHRRSGFMIALSFFAGIVTILVTLGASVSRIGSILTESFGLYWTLAMVLFPLIAASFAFRGPRPKADRLTAHRKPGLAGAFIYGLVFSLGTSAAPLLLLLTIAAAQGRPADGAMLGFAFGLGRGLPFLAIGLFTSAVLHLCRISSWYRAIETASGVALLLVSAYYVRVLAALL